MKITKIEKKKRLYLLELDDSERLYVTEDTIVKFFLSKDKNISEEELEEIRSFAQFSYGKNLALYHLSFKARTVKEVRDYLTKQEIEEDIIPQIISNLKADRWLNDARYARLYIEGNINSGNKGPLVLQQKLMLKGISKDICQEILADLDFSEMAERVAGKLLRKYEGKLPHKALLNKLTQSLMTKGFDYRTASSAIDHLDIEKDEEEDYELILAELEKLERKYARKYEGYELKQRIKQALMRKGHDFSLIDRAIRDYF